MSRRNKTVRAIRKMIRRELGTGRLALVLRDGFHREVGYDNLVPLHRDIGGRLVIVK